jgi:MFS family permease
MLADGFDLLNASIAGPALIKEWGIGRAALGPVFSASLVGFFVGAPFFGYLGDRFGRRVAIISARQRSPFAADLQQLLWLRFLSGLGLGGVLPNVIALSAEFTPKRLGATSLVVIAMGISHQLGGSAGGLCIGLLIDRFGLKILTIMFAAGIPVLVFTGTPGLSGAVLLTMAFLCGCVIVGMQNGLNAGAGLIYPTALRANGVGYALGVGRVGSVTGPLIGKAQITGQPAFRIFASAKDKFFITFAYAHLEFERDAGGKVVAAVLHQNGRVTRATRVKTE